MKTININIPYPRGIIAGGQNNTIGLGGAQRHSFIGGGQSNTVSAECASILGGQNNTVSGPFSAILGGNGNNDNGNAFTGIYGTGINATPIPSGTGALWANEIVVPNIPAGVAGGPPPGYPPGSLYFLVIGGLNQVFVV